MNIIHPGTDTPAVAAPQCPSWCESARHEQGQTPRRHWRVLVRQLLPLGDHEEVFSMWLSSSETFPEPAVAVRVGSDSIPRSVSLDALHQLRASLDMAIEAVESARTSTCADCSDPYAPFGEGDEGACLSCSLERRRARRPRLVRSTAGGASC